MTSALRRRMQELANAVPQRSASDREQMWRNVATELTLRSAESNPARARRFRSFSLFSIMALAGIMVVLQPLVSRSPSFWLRPQYLEAASRKEHSGILDWRDGHGDAQDGFRRIASNPSFELLLSESGTHFAIRHKSTGQVWSTSPDVRDARVPADLLGRMSSPFAFRFGDEGGRIEEWANPVDHMTRLVRYPLPSGMGLRFDFDTIGISIRIDYQLGDGFLQVSIPPDGIQEYGTYRVKSIELFPFFDVVEDSESKRLVVVDAAGYQELLESVDLFGYEGNAAPLLFGVTGEKAGFVAEVVEGTDSASVHIDPSGYMVHANRVFVEFQMNGAGTGSQSEPVARTVRYHMLTDDKAGHDGLAELFQRHMKERLGAAKRVNESTSSGAPIG